MNIIVNTKKALNTLCEHFAAHKIEYEQQLEGWKEKMKEYSNISYEWSKSGGAGNRPIQPHKPQKFDKEYKKYIHMLELHECDDIELEELEYEMIFQDKFGWKNTFMLNSSMYGGSLSNAQADEDNE
jgi:hypothetical protein